MDGGIHVACVSLEELCACDSNALGAFGGRDNDAMRSALADYLSRRLHTSIMTHMCGNVAIKVTSIRHPRCCHGGGRGSGGKNDASGSSRLGPTTLFVLERTNCHVLLLALGA